MSTTRRQWRRGDTLLQRGAEFTPQRLAEAENSLLRAGKPWNRRVRASIGDDGGPSSSCESWGVNEEDKGTQTEDAVCPELFSSTHTWRHSPHSPVPFFLIGPPIPTSCRSSGTFARSLSPPPIPPSLPLPLPSLSPPSPPLSFSPPLSLSPFLSSSPSPPLPPSPSPLSLSLSLSLSPIPCWIIIAIIPFLGGILGRSEAELRSGWFRADLERRCERARLDPGIHRWNGL